MQGIARVAKAKPAQVSPALFSVKLQWPRNISYSERDTTGLETVRSS